MTPLGNRIMHRDHLHIRSRAPSRQMGLRGDGAKSGDSAAQFHGRYFKPKKSLA